MDHKDFSPDNNETIVLHKILEDAVWQIFYFEDLLTQHNISYGNKAFQEFKAKNPLKQAEVMQKIENALACTNASSSSQSQGDASSNASSAKVLHQKAKISQHHCIHQLH